MARTKAPSYPSVRRRENRRKKNGERSFSWLVDLSKKEPRERLSFKSKEEAEIFAQQKRAEYKAHGTKWESMPEEAKTEAADLSNQLRARGVTLKQAVSFYFEYSRPDAGERLVKDVIEETLRKRAEAGRSAVYLQVQRSVLGVFAKAFGERKIHTIMSRDIEEWISSKPEWSPRTRRNYQRDLSTLWNYALLHKYATHNPLELLQAPSIPSEPPGILTVDQARSLLLEASGDLTTAGMVPYIAIGLFAGLRSAEIDRLEWAEIDLSAKLIEVTAKKAKTRQRRHVAISNNLLAWLKKIPKRTGKVAQGSTPYKRAVELARLAGIASWPHNALRHSFASYHLAKHKDAARTALELGHANQRLLFSNYRELVKPALAEKYWRIFPK